MTQTLFLGEEIGRASLHFVHHNSNTWKSHVKIFSAAICYNRYNKSMPVNYICTLFPKMQWKEVSYDLISILCNHKYFGLPHYLWHPENVYISYTDKLEFRISSTMREAGIFLYFCYIHKKVKWFTKELIFKSETQKKGWCHLPDYVS